MKRIDARGLACPQPVILTKKALETDEHVTTIVDNEVARANLLKLAKSQKCEASVEEEGEDFKIAFFKKREEEANDIETSQPSIAYVFKKNILGEGSEELGAMLMKSFLYTLTQMEKPPTRMIFLNGGVFLTTISLEAIEDLKALESTGTEIVSCGTCLEYFQLKDKLAVGQVSNMYEIVDMMNHADKTIMI